ncbi:hypothetical protein [Yinghuangia soli]|uniref:Uncharacterized protein n=1 Tax=Yinghuangia soli TaxID=2908204 RepID=A0AA41Q8K2_9ACTN|nr:hypothetical protein [Yinghuangia soli]MCF2533598.1 hypothetical protein [Yinghuangia soli]
MTDVPADGIPLVGRNGRPSPAVVAALVPATGATLAAVACGGEGKGLSPDHHTLGWRPAMPDGLAQLREDGSLLVTLAVAPPLLDAVVLLALAPSPSPVTASGSHVDHPIHLQIRDIRTPQVPAAELTPVPAPPPGFATVVGIIRRRGDAWGLHKPAASPTAATTLPIAHLPRIFAVLTG